LLIALIPGVLQLVAQVEAKPSAAFRLVRTAKTVWLLFSGFASLALVQLAPSFNLLPASPSRGWVPSACTELKYP
jgi:hypothetical protein